VIHHPISQSEATKVEHHQNSLLNSGRHHAVGGISLTTALSDCKHFSTNFSTVCGRELLCVMRVLISAVFLLFSSFCNGLKDRLLLACYMADVEQVKFLLSEFEAGIHHSGVVPIVIDRTEKNYGRTSLLQCGFDPQSDNLRDVDSNCTTIAHMISLHGANLSHVDKHGWNGVAIGAMKGMTKYTEFLLSRGVPIDLPDDSGRTPLMKAVVHGHLSTVKMLLEHGANITLVDHFGWSVFHFAVRQLGGHDFFLPILEFLTSTAAASPTTASSLNLQDKDGRTPLMYAAIQDTDAAIEILLRHQADPTIQDYQELTAYQIASSASMKQTLALAAANWATQEHQRWTVKVEKEMKRLQRGKKTEFEL
jgi:hypothetical protein